jgi:quinol monooxygenase YgiN
MIIVAGTFTTAPGKRDQVLEMSTGVVATTRQEEGCHEYVFSPDTEQPDIIRLYELWETAENLAAHARAPHLKEWREASTGLITGRSIKMFTVTDAQDL